MLADSDVPAEVVIDSMELFVAMATRIASVIGGPVWYRGQSDSRWELRPAVMRSERMQGHEPNRCIHFMNRARVRHQTCPDSNDLPGWLFLMQHYGLHTRLLDWTETPLVALYFALADSQSEAASVFVLSPHKLNGIHGNTEGILLPHHPNAKKLISPAFKNAEPIPEVAAILPPEMDFRMLLQRSVFTVHGDRTPLDSRPDHEQFLARMLIPRKNQAMIKAQLKVLGIDRAYLFPDLANLAESLNEGTGGSH